MKIILTNEQLKMELAFAEMIFGSGKKPDFHGQLLALNPTKEQFATFNENFADAVEQGATEDIVEGVVYFDEGAGRAFIVGEEDVEIIQGGLQ